MISLFGRKAKRKDDGARQKERELRYRSERNQWRNIAKNVREFASRRYLRGEGIEIGGLHRPLPLFEGTKVKYVDRMSTEELQANYKELAETEKVRVDIVDDGETLGKVPDESVDFVVANHMLEHTRNPIGTVQNFLRVTKPGGIVFMAIPDRRFTFDLKRQVTPFAHIRRDFEQGPDWSDLEHYQDWVRNVGPERDAEAARAEVGSLLSSKGNIHFHVWTYCEIVEMFLGMKREIGLPLEIEAAIQNGHEVVVILRKEGGGHECGIPPATEVAGHAS